MSNRKRAGKVGEQLRGYIFDTGGLIALERKERVLLALVARTEAFGIPVVIPTGVLAQVIRQPAKQVFIWRLLRQENTSLIPLDLKDALAVGVSLAKSQTTDIVDAHVVLCARRAGHAIVTSDPDDLRRLDTSVDLVTI